MVGDRGPVGRAAVVPPGSWNAPVVSAGFAGVSAVVGDPVGAVGAAPLVVGAVSVGETGDGGTVFVGPVGSGVIVGCVGACVGLHQPAGTGGTGWEGKLDVQYCVHARWQSAAGSANAGADPPATVDTASIAPIAAVTTARFIFEKFTVAPYSLIAGP